MFTHLQESDWLTPGIAQIAEYQKLALPSLSPYVFSELVYYETTRLNEGKINPFTHFGRLQFWTPGLVRKPDNVYQQRRKMRQLWDFQFNPKKPQ